MSDDGTGTPLSRRAFLGTAALGTVVVGGAAAGGIRLASAARGDGESVASPEPVTPRGFRGLHQIGVLERPRPHGLIVAFDSVAADRRALQGTFLALSEELDSLLSGRVPPETTSALPPPDSGVLEEVSEPGLMATVSVGASLFDDRYGLADRKPRELTTMPFLANDRLDPARSHGDVLLALQGKEPDVCVHALRRVIRRTQSGLVVKWMQDTFTRPDAIPKVGQTQSRNLLGFKDGTANPDAGDEALMNTLVWTSTGDTALTAPAREPDWTVGGTYQVVRIIRMLVERWDRAALEEQEAIFGRRKVSGAPLSGEHESDLPVYTNDPQGTVTPLNAHIRLANPRTPQTAPSRILRRGYNYDRGVDEAGDLDMGLIFTCYQQDLQRQFEAVQKRLINEPLTDYIIPFGGGYFLALPGVTVDNDYYGRALLA